MNGEGYFRRAARVVFRDRTWWWRALVIGAVGLVPIVGVWVVLGYHMVLERQTAWGIDGGLPRFSDLEEIVRRAVDGLAVYFVWALVLVIPFAALIFGWIFSNISTIAGGNAPAMPWWFTLAFWFSSVALSLLTHVAVLRAAIYVRARAGLSFSAVIDLIKRSPAGFRSVSALAVVVSFVGLVLTSPNTYARAALHLPQTAMLGLTYGWGFVAATIVAPLWLVVYVAYGLWAQEMDPATWPPLTQPAVADDSFSSWS